MPLQSTCSWRPHGVRQSLHQIQILDHTFSRPPPRDINSCIFRERPAELYSHWHYAARCRFGCVMGWPRAPLERYSPFNLVPIVLNHWPPPGWAKVSKTWNRWQVCYFTLLFLVLTMIEYVRLDSENFFARCHRAVQHRAPPKLFKLWLPLDRQKTLSFSNTTRVRRQIPAIYSHQKGGDTHVCSTTSSIARRYRKLKCILHEFTWALCEAVVIEYFLQISYKIYLTFVDTALTSKPIRFYRVNLSHNIIAWTNCTCVRFLEAARLRISDIYGVPYK